MSDKVLEIITNQIMNNIMEKKQFPWNNPVYFSPSNVQRNLITNEAYRGINILLTAMSGFASPFWLSFDQAKDRKLYLKPMQNYTPIVWWNIKEDKETGKVKFFGCKYYRVYNLTQFKDWENVKTPDSDKEIPVFVNNKIEIAESIVAGYKNAPEMEFVGSRPCYIPSIDKIKVPEISNFISSEHFYATLFHEMVHSTGHEKRLKRKGIVEMDGFGGKNYSFEELVAEIGSAMLCNNIGIDNEPLKNNSVAYIESWLNAFRKDIKMLPMAAQASQKAVDLILGKSHKED